MRRRMYLSSMVAGVTVISGCSESEGEESVEATPSTSSPTPTASNPEIEIVDAGPSKTEIAEGTIIEFLIELKNTGGDGTIPLQIELDNNVVYDETITVDWSRTVENLEMEHVPAGYHEYTVRAQNDTMSGAFSVGTPVEKPQVVTQHTVLRKEQYNVADTTRVNFHVEVKGNPYRGVAPPSRDELLDICRKIILDELETREWDVIGFNIWRKSQTVGEEASHTTITWGPNGNWSGAGAGEKGDYSNYEFDVEGAEYLVTEGVDDVRTDKWDFRVEFDIVNHGVIPGELSGSVSTPQTEEYEFEVSLAPGNRTSIWYEGVYDGYGDSTTYTIEVYGFNLLYGDTGGEIEFY